MISSNIKPNEFIIGTNSAVINYGLVEEVVNEVTTYSYCTMEYPATNQVVLDRMKAKLENTADKKEAKRYLADTDWYIARRTETGVEVPAEVLAKRAECREIL